MSKQSHNYKSLPAFVTKVDANQGIVEHIIAVMGIIDLGDDIIYPGAFVKTIAERGLKVRCLDQHQTDSILRVLGKPLEIREIGKSELPPDLLAKYPSATGGVKVVTQFLLDTAEGKGAFIRIKEGAVDEWSFGYDVPEGGSRYSKINGRMIREIRDLKLWEYSPVLWGMNPATATLGAKANSESKPYRAIHDDDGKWRVYKIDSEGKPTGEALGAHDTESDANAQVAALYANTDEGKSTNLSGTVRKVESAFESSYNVPGSPMEYYVSEVYDDFVVVCCYGRGPTMYYQVAYTVAEDGTITFAMRAEWLPGEYVFVVTDTGSAMATMSKAGRVQAARNQQRIRQIQKLLAEMMTDAGMVDDSEDDDNTEGDSNDSNDKAGPDSDNATPPTLLGKMAIDLIELIDFEQQLKNMEA